MSAQPIQPPNSPNFNQPDTLATPEGDNEDLPTEPLSPNPPEPLRPRGDEPHYNQPERPALD